LAELGAACAGRGIYRINTDCGEKNTNLSRSSIHDHRPVQTKSAAGSSLEDFPSMWVVSHYLATYVRGTAFLFSEIDQVL
jgi:hypothetical protein